MFVFKRLDGLRNWLKGRALFISSLRYYIATNVVVLVKSDKCEISINLFVSCRMLL